MPKLDPEGMVRSFFKVLPKMATGEIDYSSAKTAVVVTVFVMHKQKVLIVKRSRKVSGYKGKWNAISGYVDEMRPIREIALKEISEEVRINKSNVLKVKPGKVYSFRDAKEKMKWVVCPYLVETKRKPRIILDWENTDYKWISPKEISNFDIVPNLDRSLGNILGPL